MNLEYRFGFQSEHQLGILLRYLDIIKKNGEFVEFYFDHWAESLHLISCFNLRLITSVEWLNEVHIIVGLKKYYPLI